MAKRSTKQGDASPYWAGAMGEPELFRLLEQRYPVREYALLGQVPTGTGFRREPRLADAVALSLWPSRGLTLTGFEIKSYRGDWRREKSEPAKAEAIAAFCDFWFLVAANERVVPLDELPEPWGLMVPDKTGKQLVTVKGAQRLHTEPPIWGRAFVAGLLRRAAEAMVPNATVNLKTEEAYAKGKADAERRDPEANELKRLRDIEARADRFAEASGISMRFSSDQELAALGAACRIVRQVRSHREAVRTQIGYRIDGVRRQLQALQRGDALAECQRQMSAIETAIGELASLDLDDAGAVAQVLAQELEA